MSNPGEPAADGPSETTGVRFDATLHAPKGSPALDRLGELDVDRVPDRKGRIRALITADELPRLLDMGFQVRLHRAHPIEPLDRRLIASDASVRRWIEESLAGIDHPPLSRTARPRKPRKRT